MQDKFGDWRQTDQCSMKTLKKNKDKLYCHVKMRTLYEEYGLVKNALIRIQIKAFNKIGESEWSDVNKKGASVRSPPIQMPSPA